MKITSINVRKVEKEDSNLRAFVNITIDNALAVKDLRIIDGNNGLFVAMPSRKNKDGEYRDIVHPINQEVRDMMEDAIIKAYNEAEYDALVWNVISLLRYIWKNISFFYTYNLVGGIYGQGYNKL